MNTTLTIKALILMVAALVIGVFVFASIFVAISAFNSNAASSMESFASDGIAEAVKSDPENNLVMLACARRIIPTNHDDTNLVSRGGLAALNYVHE